VEVLLADRPLDRLRSVHAILRLEETVGAQRLEAACARTVYHGDLRYRRIKDILNVALDREPLPDAITIQPNSPHTFARPTTDFFPQVGHEHSPFASQTSPTEALRDASDPRLADGPIH